MSHQPSAISHQPTAIGQELLFQTLQFFRQARKGRQEEREVLQGPPETLLVNGLFGKVSTFLALAPFAILA
jgi:hypothetical protein